MKDLGLGSGGYEVSLLLGTAAVRLCLTGPGRFSLDHLMSPTDA